MTSLVIDGVGMTLGGRVVLDAVAAHLAPSTVTAILGPNGAGKSTLLACMAGLRRPSQGCVCLGASEVTRLDPRERARLIGFMPQSPDVHWNVDVRTLVSFGRLPHRAAFAAETTADHQAVMYALERTDTLHLAHRSVATLSGGERARVLFARVLAGEPSWLLADEPLANLDPAHQLDTLALLRAAADAGAGVVVVLHDLTQAARVADRILLIQNGRAIADGSPAQVLQAETLARVYGVDVHIGTVGTGEPLVVPLSRRG